MWTLFNIRCYWIAAYFWMVMPTLHLMMLMLMLLPLMWRLLSTESPQTHSYSGIKLRYLRVVLWKVSGKAMSETKEKEKKMKTKIPVSNPVIIAPATKISAFGKQNVAHQAIRTSGTILLVFLCIGNISMCRNVDAINYAYCRLSSFVMNFFFYFYLVYCLFKR